LVVNSFGFLHNARLVFGDATALQLHWNCYYVLRYYASSVIMQKCHRSKFFRTSQLSSIKANKYNRPTDHDNAVAYLACS